MATPPKTPPAPPPRPASPRNEAKARTLGLTSATGLVVGSIVGTGIFTVPAVLAGAGTMWIVVLGAAHIAAAATHPVRVHGLAQDCLRDEDFVLASLPNHLFQRDNSAWIYGGVSVHPMAKPARQRETMHSRAIYRYHPMFASSEFEFWYGGDDAAHLPAAAVEIVAQALFAQGHATQVIAIELPRLPDLWDAIAAALDVGKLRVLAADEDLRAAEREQWDDGTNFLAVAPGVILGYERNVTTNTMLRRAGIEVVSVVSSELGRGRGGPRCMVCPIQRNAA